MDDQLLDLGAQGEERFDVFGFGGLHAPVDFRLQVVVFDKALVGTGGDAEPRRHAHVQSVFDLSQVGHLAADHVRQSLGHVGQGDHQTFVFDQLAAGQDLVDALLDAVEAREEARVFFRCEPLDRADHGEHVHGNRGAGGPHEGHPEGAAAVQGLLDAGHDLERLVVGGEQQLEAVVAIPELDAQGVDVHLDGSIVRLPAGEYPS